ncbi:MAG: DUF4262 domain-containing protein [Bradyrhizobium sp.]|nr:DUF4262 domain-containing protein [Bradyrhizobium sp.]
MFENFQWPEPEEEADEILIRNVRERGCHILGVAAEKGSPPFTFSIGLALNYGQAEIIIFGMDPRKSARIINIVRDHAASGKKYVDGEVSSDILVNLNVCFIEVPLDLYDEYLGTAIWFYRKSPRPFPCLQLVWPDRAGRFPWETGFDAAMKKDQTVLRSIS